LVPKAKSGGRWRLVLVSRVAAVEKMKAWVFYLLGGCRGRKRDRRPWVSAHCCEEEAKWNPPSPLCSWG